MTRRILTGLAAVVLLAVGCLVSSGSAAAQEWEVHQWNMTAAADDSHYITDHDIAIWLVTADHPAVVSFNEICSGVAQRLKAEFRALGYAAQVSVRNYVGTVPDSRFCRDRQSRGSMVFVIGSNHRSSCSSSSCAIPLTQAPGDGDTRRVICNRTDTYLGPLVGCSAHLTRLGQDVTPSIAQQQAEQVRSGVSSLYPGLLKVLAGDFNLRPAFDGTVAQNRWVPSAWYTHYLEGAQDEPTTASGIKIDHIFGQRNMLAFRWAPVLLQFPDQDHKYYKAFFYS